MKSIGYMEHWIQSYLQAEYYDTEQENFCRIGDCSDSWLKWIKAFGKTYCYVTPYNPHSIMLPQKENRFRRERFFQQLKVRNHFCRKAHSQAPDGSFREEGAFIFDLSFADAIRWGRVYDQNAIVFGSENSAPELVLCLS